MSFANFPGHPASGDAARYAYDRARDDGTPRFSSNVRTPSRSSRQRTSTRDLETLSEDIDKCLADIRREWPDMIGDSCNPLLIALRSLKSGQRNSNSFSPMQKQVEGLLRDIAHHHHDSFSEVLDKYEDVKDCIQTSVSQIRELKGDLAAAKSHVSIPKGELSEAVAESAAYGDMLGLLRKIKEAKEVPLEMDDLVSSKKFIAAVQNLKTGLQTVRTPELDQIGALSGLRLYFSNQEQHLSGLMIEELNSLLYPSLREGYDPGVARDAEAKASRKAFITFLSRLDAMDRPLAEDLDGDRSAFDKIWQTVQALHNLGRLPTALESIGHRMKSEIHNIIQMSALEVGRRHPHTFSALTAKTFDIDPTYAQRKIILTDFLSTMFHRLEAITETHQAMYAAIATVMKHEEWADEEEDSSNETNQKVLQFAHNGPAKLCELFEGELEELLYNHISTDSGEALRKPAPPLTGMRNRNRPLFRIDRMKSESLESSRAALSVALEATVPGLSTKEPEEEKVEVKEDGPKPIRLVSAWISNMRVLLPATLGFIARIDEVLPKEAVDVLRAWRDRFLSNVFLPLMDSSLGGLAGRVIEDANAFEQDPDWATRAGRPIFRGVSQFFSIIDSFCRMLDELSEYIEFGGGSVISRHVTIFYNRCVSYLGLIIYGESDCEGSLELASRIVETLQARENLKDLSLESLSLNESDAEADFLAEQLRSQVKAGSVQLNSSVLASLCVLHNSMKWIGSKLMRSSTATAGTMSSSVVFQRSDALVGGKNKTAEGAGGAKSKPKLSSSATLAPAFEKLAKRVLLLLRVEVRCHAAYFIHQFLHPSRCKSGQAGGSNEPDPEAKMLAQDLSGLDETMHVILSRPHPTEVLSGLSMFMDRLMVGLLLKAEDMSAEGCHRQQLNVLAVQHNLAALSGCVTAPSPVGPPTSLWMSGEILDNVNQGADTLFGRVEEVVRQKGARGLLPAGLNPAQTRRLMELCWSEDLNDPDRARRVRARQHFEGQMREFEKLLAAVGG